MLSKTNVFKVTLLVGTHLFCTFMFYFILSLAKAPPKEIPKTIENQRVYDETTVDPEDEEVFTKFGRACWNRLRL